MPLFWLRVATVLYGVCLVYALILLFNRGEKLASIAIHAGALGLILHCVSVVETALMYGYLDLLTIRYAESNLALILMALFMFLYVRYESTAPGLFIFPVAFLLTFGSALGQPPRALSSPTVRSGWILVHVSMLLVGYAALFLSFLSSLLYLVQSHRLKSKHTPHFASRLPALQVLDELGYKSLLVGFPFITVGLIIGSVVAQERFGAHYFADPKVLLSLLTWGVYMVLLYTRWSSGWRGRKAAYLATFAFAAAVCAWAANYLSRVHRFVAP
ncbi:MAG: cytochrome c biogenesis protein CcsA [Candidatus Korobacteraceae bacterium]|jgi:ABC-type uncharacterized transport system permease subunit